MRQHRVVALVVRHHQQGGFRVLGGHVTQVERQVEIQRVLAPARVRHQRHSLVRRLQLLGAFDLVGPVKQPHVGEPGRQLQELFNRWLDVFVVHQHV
ncbi:MAG TPA: hypothetical protein DCY64_09845 [Hydrogenophaga sp.]|nr:hypothetical protein [Hydrogenophaga sp.]HBU19221.1 hypothetical protein [Hydrogenophaga sp.]